MGGEDTSPLMGAPSSEVSGAATPDHGPPTTGLADGLEADRMSPPPPVVPMHTPTVSRPTGGEVGGGEVDDLRSTPEPSTIHSPLEPEFDSRGGPIVRPATGDKVPGVVGDEENLLPLVGETPFPEPPSPEFSEKPASGGEVTAPSSTPDLSDPKVPELLGGLSSRRGKQEETSQKGSSYSSKKVEGGKKIGKGDPMTTQKAEWGQMKDGGEPPMWLRGFMLIFGQDGDEHWNYLARWGLGHPKAIRAPGIPSSSGLSAATAPTQRVSSIGPTADEMLRKHGKIKYRYGRIYRKRRVGSPFLEAKVFLIVLFFQLSGWMMAHAEEGAWPVWWMVRWRWTRWFILDFNQEKSYVLWEALLTSGMLSVFLPLVLRVSFLVFKAQSTRFKTTSTPTSLRVAERRNRHYGVELADKETAADHEKMEKDPLVAVTRPEWSEMEELFPDNGASSAAGVAKRGKKKKKAIDDGCSSSAGKTVSLRKNQEDEELILARGIDGDNQVAYRMKALRRSRYMQWVGHMLWRFLFVPIAAHAALVWPCTTRGLSTTVTIAQAVACNSWEHSLLKWVNFGFACVWIGAYPVWVWKQVDKVVIFTDWGRHRRFVARWRTEYSARLSDNYADAKCYLFDPFTRSMVHFDSVAAWMVGVWALGTMVSQDSQTPGLVGSLVFGFWAFLAMVRRPFRHGDTSFAHWLLILTLMANAMLLFFAGTEVRSPLLVAKSLAVWLGLLNLGGLILGILISIFGPVLGALGRRGSHDANRRHTKVFTCLVVDVARRCRAITDQYFSSDPLFVNVSMYHHIAKELKTIEYYADECLHPLGPLIREQHHAMVALATRASQKSLLPHPALNPLNVHEVQDMLKERAMRTILQKRVWARAVLKITAVNAFLGDRKGKVTRMTTY